MADSFILTKDKEYVLTKEGVETLAKQILAEVNNRINKRMVTGIDEDSDDKHVPTAKTVYDAVEAIDRVLPLVIADGDITKAQITPDEKTLYVVRTSAEEKEGTPWIWLQSVGYVKATPTVDPYELNPMSEEDIIDAVEKAAEETDPDAPPEPIIETAQVVVTYQGPDDGEFVTPEGVVQVIQVGYPYAVESPEVVGYTPDHALISGTMPPTGVEALVTYTKNPPEEPGE